MNAEDLQALQSLGITLPSPSYIVAVLLFSVLGMVAWVVGKRRQHPRTRWLGLALMLYPYVVWETWMVWVVGLALCAAIVVGERA